MSGERRKAPRFDVSCRCWLERDSVTLFGTVTNISAGGFFVRTVPAVDVGRGVEIHLSLEDGIVTGQGAVRWRARTDDPRSGPTRTPGMGIELVGVSSGAELLEAYLDRKSVVPEP